MVAAVFMVKCFYDFGFNYWFALLLSLGLAAAVGALSELLLRRLFNRPRVLVMVATIGLSQVLFVFTALPFIRPKNLFKAFPVPFDISFPIGTYLFTPGEVLTLIAAPLVAIGLAAFIKWSPWGLAMRAMAENADSARLSGVWVRRTSTMAWTLAGVLSAFTAILAAPGQTSQLTEVLSPELLLLALTAAMVGAMVNLTVAFVAAIGVGVIQEILVWNLSSTNQVDLVLFALVMVVLLVRIAALQTGSRREERSTWLENTRVQLRNEGPLRRKVGERRGGARRDRGGPAAAGGEHGQLVPDLPDLHLRGHRPVADRAHRLGRPGVARAVRAGGRGRAHGRPPRHRACRWSCSCPSPARSPRWWPCWSACPPSGSAASTWP